MPQMLPLTKFQARVEVVLACSLISRVSKVIRNSIVKITAAQDALSSQQLSLDGLRGYRLLPFDNVSVGHHRHFPLHMQCRCETYSMHVA